MDRIWLYQSCEATAYEGHSLLFTTKSPGVPGNHLSTIEEPKAELFLKPLSGFESETPRLGIQYLNH